MRAPIFVLALIFVAPAALARPWQGIEPGSSTRQDVVKKFGEPSKVVPMAGGKETLAYFQKQAIRGTTQAQFRVDQQTGKVERIDVFPGPVVERETVEATYGPPCSASGKQPAAACFIKKLTDDFRTYYLYQRLGLAIFFNEDGKTVHSFVFQSPKDAT